MFETSLLHCVGGDVDVSIHCIEGDVTDGATFPENDVVKAEIRSCKVAQVHIFRATERKHKQQNEAYDRDREQDLVSEVSPHADGTIFRREIVVIICHNKYHLSS